VGPNRKPLLMILRAFPQRAARATIGQILHFMSEFCTRLRRGLSLPPLDASAIEEQGDRMKASGFLELGTARALDTDVAEAPVGNRDDVRGQK
jgi:hypothetical protein